jgi:Zn-dependent peptidase ImmA (M78 family)
MSDYTFTDDNRQRIGKIAFDIRNKHNAMEWGTNPVELIRLEGLDYGEYNLEKDGVFKKFAREAIVALKGISKKIMAALFVKDKTVLIDESLHNAKKPFGQAHELGHYVIPAHKEILYACSEHDLCESIRLDMEFEANVFASELLFPAHLLQAIHQKYPLSMQTIQLLKAHSGASMHSSAIRYVKTSPNICCLVQLKRSNTDNPLNNELLISSIICSKSWWNKYRYLINKDQILPNGHNLSKVINTGSRDGILETTVKVDEIEFNAHTFYNSYIVLALIFEK